MWIIRTIDGETDRLKKATIKAAFSYNRFLNTLLLLVRNDEFVALTVDVDDLHLVIVLEVLTQLGDVHVHRTGVEVVVVDPDGAKRIITLQNLVSVRAEQ